MFWNRNDHPRDRRTGQWASKQTTGSDDDLPDTPPMVRRAMGMRKHYTPQSGDLWTIPGPHNTTVSVLVTHVDTQRHTVTVRPCTTGTACRTWPGTLTVDTGTPTTILPMQYTIPISRLKDHTASLTDQGGRQADATLDTQRFASELADRQTNPPYDDKALEEFNRTIGLLTQQATPRHA